MLLGHEGLYGLELRGSPKESMWVSGIHYRDLLGQGLSSGLLKKDVRC